MWATPNQTDAASISQEFIRYDERMRNNVGAVAIGNGMPSSGAAKRSADLPPKKYLIQET